MPLDVNNFLLSLAVFMASTATADGGGDVAFGTNLFALQADEAAAGNNGAGPYAVLVPYGGPSPEDLLVVGQISVQCATYAKQATAGMALAQRFFEACLEKDSEGEVHPRNTFLLPAKKYAGGNLVDDADVGNYDVHLIDIHQPPGLIGRDDAGRNNIVFNFDVRFELPE